MIARPRQHTEGFTLAEALLAAAVLSMTVAAILIPFTVAAVNQHADARITTATLLAEEIMEEILAKPFHDPNGPSLPGPEAGELSRSQFDNIDDYHGYAEAEGNIVSSGGVVCDEPAAVGLSRSVSGAYVYVSGQDASGEPNFIRVTVDVRYHGQPVVSLTRLVHSLD